MPLQAEKTGPLSATSSEPHAALPRGAKVTETI